MTFGTDELEWALGNELYFDESNDLFEWLGHEILLGCYQQIRLDDLGTKLIEKLGAS